MKLSDSEGSRSSSDAKKKTDKRKLSAGSDVISEGVKPPRKAQRKSQEERKCNGEDTKDDVIAISDDDDDDVDDKKDVKANGSNEVKKDGGDNQQNETTEDSDVSKDIKKEVENAQVKGESDDKNEVMKEADDKSTIAKSLKQKQQQMSVECNMIERLDGGEMITTNVMESGADSPNTIKLKTEALAKVRGAKVCM